MLPRWQFHTKCLSLLYLSCQHWLFRSETVLLAVDAEAIIVREQKFQSMRETDLLVHSRHVASLAQSRFSQELLSRQLRREKTYPSHLITTACVMALVRDEDFDVFLG